MIDARVEALNDISSLGGSVVSHELITHDMLIRLGAQLHEGQAAKEIKKQCS